MVVRIMTFVTNGGGVGPGHSAVTVDGSVYTFEETVAGWFSATSGWKKLKYDDYLASNKHRPVLVQYLSSKAVGDRVTAYVNASIARDDDYGSLSAGVCSTQVSKAVDNSLPADIIFDPKGFDTPFGVYHCARRLQLVTKEEYFWPGQADMTIGQWSSIVNKLKSDFPAAHKAMTFSR